jgi:hypothetical protein
MAFACVYYPRSNPGGKGSLTTSWTGFILDTQGQIPYSPSPKKKVLITYYQDQSFECEVRKMQEELLIQKIRRLPPEKAAEVEDFVDFLFYRNDDQQLVEAAAKISESAFRKAWDNPEDAEYDRL